jgi:propanol-preferring alcohol dehydrogenase
LCPEARFTGFHDDGGFAEYLTADADFVLSLPQGLSDEAAAPLLCAGIIGYRSLRRADLGPGETLGLIGFGASAHLALPVARSWGCRVFVFTRGKAHRRLALRLGAEWAGGIEDRAPAELDRAVLFAPIGDLVPPILERLRPGGTLAINAVHLSPIPQMPYHLLYGERTLKTVANATRQDGQDFLRLAAELNLRPTYAAYPLEEANQALADLRHSRLEAAAVLLP